MTSPGRASDVCGFCGGPLPCVTHNQGSSDITELELRVAVAIATRRDAFRPSEKLARGYLDDARVAIEVIRSIAYQGKEPLFEQRDRITREMLRAEPHTLFVFGDNMVARGLGGQAKELRGEPNAVGIPTKQLPEMSEMAFFRDEDLPRAREKIDRAFLRLTFHMLKGGKIVWPAAGIGTGLAQLEQRAPAIWQLIESGRKGLASSSLPSTDREGK